MLVLVWGIDIEQARFQRLGHVFAEHGSVTLENQAAVQGKGRQYARQRAGVVRRFIQIVFCHIQNGLRRQEIAAGNHRVRNFRFHHESIASCLFLCRQLLQLIVREPETGHFAIDIPVEAMDIFLPAGQHELRKPVERFDDRSLVILQNLVTRCA